MFKKLSLFCFQISAIIGCYQQCGFKKANTCIFKGIDPLC